LYFLQSLEPEELVNQWWPDGLSSLMVTRQCTLSCLPSSVGILHEQWIKARVDVRFRDGGEKIRLPGRQGSHLLKKLFQEAGIPPWERAAIPLIYLDGTLAAVGDRWISAEFYSEKKGGCIRLSYGEATHS
jgi:tRNA(Ile)-lysidine synthase